MCDWHAAQKNLRRLHDCHADEAALAVPQWHASRVPVGSPSIAAHGAAALGTTHPLLFPLLFPLLLPLLLLPLPLPLLLPLLRWESLHSSSRVLNRLLLPLPPPPPPPPPGGARPKQRREAPTAPAPSRWRDPWQPGSKRTWHGPPKA